LRRSGRSYLFCRSICPEMSAVPLRRSKSWWWCIKRTLVVIDYPHLDQSESRPYRDSNGPYRHDGA
jgi:hypothetical protein